MTLLSALGGGLFLIPLILLLAALWSFYRTYLSWKSGSAGWKWYGNIPKWEESDERVKITSIGAFWFGAAFLLFSIVTFILMQAEK